MHRWRQQWGVETTTENSSQTGAILKRSTISYKNIQRTLNSLWNKRPTELVRRTDDWVCALICDWTRHRQDRSYKLPQQLRCGRYGNVDIVINIQWRDKLFSILKKTKTYLNPSTLIGSRYNFIGGRHNNWFWNIWEWWHKGWYEVCVPKYFHSRMRFLWNRGESQRI